MGRKKRNTKTEQKSLTEQNVYPTAIYARLSLENSGKEENHDVISNQIEICKSHISGCPYLTLVDTYIDNGKTGTVFDRPQFNRLIDDIKAGKIKCLVVRDLSRFGRDYVEAGIYLERIFPNIGVRFISVKERYDSFDTDGKSESLMIPLQNMINTLYSKDISRKVSSAHRTRMTSGDFKRSTLPYGYILDETRTKVLIDEQTADFVRKIYKWKIEGVSIPDMITRLKELNAPNPKFWKSETGVSIYKDTEPTVWHRATINNILKNHAYLGNTILGRTIHALYKGIPYKICKDEADWLIIENTHEAIISCEDFLAVRAIFEQSAVEKQRKMSKSQKGRDKLIDLFEGKIFCADCGKRMYIKKEQKEGNYFAVYKCSSYVRKLGSGCRSHYVRQEQLNTKVLSAIRTQVKVALDYEKLILLLQNSEGEKSIRDKYNALITSLNLKLNALQKRRTRLYEDYVDAVLSEDEYLYVKQSYDDEFSELSEQLEKAILGRTEFQSSMSSNNKWISLMKSISRAKTLTQELVREVIERIDVYEDGSIELTMKYADIYSLTVKFTQKVQGVA